MPNALNAHSSALHKVFMLGDTGSGKTTQFLTLPGKKFAYLFDPNALLSLQGFDVDYEEYLPDQISISVKSLKTEGSERIAKGDRSSVTKSDLYQKWEQDFNAKLNEGFFEPYDWIALDSATTLLDLIMDRVLTINGRFGQWPNQDDYGPQMLTFTNICRSLTSLGKSVYLTGHLETRQDQLTKKIQIRPMMTGRLVNKIPLLFSEVLALDCTLDENGKPAYRMQTVPDQMMRTIRTSIKGLEPYENVTIDFTQPVEGQGLGGILSWWHRRRQEKV